MEKVIDVTKWVLAVAIGFITSALGGFDNLLILLNILTSSDVFSGCLKGAKQKKFSSSILLWGLINKAFIYVIIAIMHQVDTVLGLNILRNTFIIWFGLCEAASIIENSAIIGVPWPDGLLNILVQVRKGFSINISKIVTKIIDEYKLESESEKNE